jgi:hypothetical protein
MFFKIFLARNHFKKIQKQHVSTKLDKGFRLVYELSYFDEKIRGLKIFHFSRIN